MTYPRPLSQREVEVLNFLLSPDDDRLIPLRTQIASATVTGLCGCGCPSIHLAVDRTLAPAGLDSPAVKTYTREEPGMDPKSTCFLLLFLDEGFLSYMELAWVSDDPPTEYPAVSTFLPPTVSSTSDIPAR